MNNNNYTGSKNKNYNHKSDSKNNNKLSKKKSTNSINSKKNNNSNSKNKSNNYNKNSNIKLLSSKKKSNLNNINTSSVKSKSENKVDFKTKEVNSDNNKKTIINWYPGHMTKALRMMKEDIKLIDLVIEICDARIPISSRNPDIDKLADGKARMILLNKSDLADPKINDKWKCYYEKNGIVCLLIDSKKSIGFKDIKNAVSLACKDKIEKDRAKGIINRPLRAMVCGIPNVGKSTFINSYAKKACTKTGNKPGVTKGKQWIRLDKTLELLDTPGVLWPKFESPEVGMNLAMIGSINDEIIHEDELAISIIEFMSDKYSGVIEEKYSIDLCDNTLSTIEKIGISRGCIAKGGECDFRKASKLIIEDFRTGRLGRLTIERVNLD